MNLKWVDNVAQLLEKGAEAPGFNLFPIYSGPFAYLKEGHTAGAPPVLANARITKVCVGSEEYAVVILCIIDEEEGTPRWSICCGDPQVSGKYANEGKTLAEILRKQGVVGQKVCNTLELSPWVGQIKEQGNCGFHRMQERHANGGPWRLCSHAAAVLHSEEKPVLESMAEELQRWLSGEDNGLDDVISSFPEEEAILDAAFVQNVLLAGERGSGKTYFARKVAELFGAIYIELQAHASVEAYELRAHDRAWNGKVYTVLGKLAEAVYWIQKGKRVVLCIDEFLNMNPMHTTVINSALTLTANDTYLIETGRIIDLGDGIGRVETVEVPADMLWVVATTNIGARYNIDKMPPSVRARFQIILMNTNAERTVGKVRNAGGACSYVSHFHRTLQPSSSGKQP